MDKLFSRKDFPVFAVSTEGLHQLLVIINKNRAEKSGTSVQGMGGKELWHYILLILTQGYILLKFECAVVKSKNQKVKCAHGVALGEAGGPSV